MSCCSRITGYTATSIGGAQIIRLPAGTTVSAFPWNTQPWGLEVLSSSPSDTALGVGARTIACEILDGEGIARTVIVTLDGVTPVPVGAAVWRINNAWVISAGTSSSNVGALTFRETNGGTTQLEMIATRGKTWGAVWCCPSNSQAEITALNIIGNRTPAASLTTPYSIILTIRNSVTGAIRDETFYTTTEGVSIDSLGPIKLNALEEFIPQINHVAAGTTVNYGCAYEACITGQGYAVIPGGFGPPK